MSTQDGREPPKHPALPGASEDEKPPQQQQLRQGERWNSAEHIKQQQQSGQGSI